MKKIVSLFFALLLLLLFCVPAFGNNGGGVYVEGGFSSPSSGNTVPDKSENPDIEKEPFRLIGYDGSNGRDFPLVPAGSTFSGGSVVLVVAVLLAAAVLVFVFIKKKKK